MVASAVDFESIRSLGVPGWDDPPPEDLRHGLDASRLSAMDDDRKTGIVVDLRQHLTGKNRPYIYPLDRAHELRITGWTADELIREAMEAGYVITRGMIRSWVKRGLIPPPKR